MPLPRLMQAVRNVDNTGPAGLQVTEVPVPAPAADQALIEVHYAGVTFPDVLQTRGDYQLRIPLPFTVGCEFAGVVVAAGPDAGVVPGQRVAAIGPSGAFAEYALVGSRQVLPLPDELSFEDAAALPMNVLTADFALTHRGGLLAGECVLVHGAAGGLGTALVQRAKLASARVIAVVSSAEKAAVARAAGADETIVPEGFLQTVRELTDGRGVDIVADPVGGDRFTDSLRCLATNGRLLVLGFTGRSIPEVKVNRLLLTNTAVIGVAWGGLMATGAISPRDQWESLGDAVGAGTFRPPSATVHALADAPAAIASLDDRSAVGKLIIRMREA
ncbi:NADPH:quinone oxidoreductase family protein [Microbacterium sp. zg-Y818]|uniref:NADPH:quinone oxidoreductase family protein n=1 Tax=unclassified Microbacterium TaxID=2609290 RepID=UPI00214C7958|nr:MULTISPECIES: NADPH:quinone oxidoreductase family protein [unclassified Microbacterium]MCR2799295.1 NADPH:quinone oxidoreductase family protein [Microbacterium sp. zg.Y818]WIM21297.1 NADPH:quinone oxidoreductase family protein [Microbacterium sp. zg-Y818]